MCSSEFLYVYLDHLSYKMSRAQKGKMGPMDSMWYSWWLSKSLGILVFFF